MIAFGRHVCGNLDAGAGHEWLVTDGLGGYAMGTVAGLRTRRYHGLLVIAAPGASARRLGLAAQDPLVRIGDRVVRLATGEWVGGAVDPGHLASFRLDGGVPCWCWDLGDVVLQREIAMAHGRPAVGVLFRLLHSPRPVKLELTPLCTWRVVHGERQAWAEPSGTAVADGFVFEVPRPTPTERRIPAEVAAAEQPGACWACRGNASPRPRQTRGSDAGYRRC